SSRTKSWSRSPTSPHAQPANWHAVVCRPRRRSPTPQPRRSQAPPLVARRASGVASKRLSDRDVVGEWRSALKLPDLGYVGEVGGVARVAAHLPTRHAITDVDAKRPNWRAVA